MEIYSFYLVDKTSMFDAPGAGICVALGASAPMEEKETGMPTIIEYSDAVPSRNDYPERIVSPMTPRSCCLTHMVEVGSDTVEGNWVYKYKRCEVCGFTVRVVLRGLPDPDMIAYLQTTFRERSFAGL